MVDTEGERSCKLRKGLKVEAVCEEGKPQPLEFSSTTRVSKELRDLHSALTLEGRWPQHSDPRALSLASSPWHCKPPALRAWSLKPPVLKVYGNKPLDWKAGLRISETLRIISFVNAKGPAPYCQ